MCTMTGHACTTVAACMFDIFLYGLLKSAHKQFYNGGLAFGSHALCGDKSQVKQIKCIYMVVPTRHMSRVMRRPHAKKIVHTTQNHAMAWVLDDKAVHGI